MAGAEIGSAFIPVSDPERAAEWYERVLGLSTREISPWAAQLQGSDPDRTSLTLMGPRSGVAAKPGLAFATCNFVVDDLPATRGRLERAGHSPSPVDGSADVCLFFTMSDPDGNVLLIVDR